jgi:hypothetical protein
MKVCCISAKARHGKDTAAAMMAEYLEKQGYRVLITHFADLLKFICTKFLVGMAIKMRKAERFFNM